MMIRTFADGTMAERSGMLYEAKGSSACFSCAFSDGTVCEISNLEYDCTFSHFEPMNIGSNGWRSKSTHVRKFGGVWCQLYPDPNENDGDCVDCAFISKFCSSLVGCEADDGIFKHGGYWKEIGEK